MKKTTKHLPTYYGKDHLIYAINAKVGDIYYFLTTMGKFTGQDSPKEVIVFYCKENPIYRNGKEVGVLYEKVNDKWSIANKETPVYAIEGLDKSVERILNLEEPPSMDDIQDDLLELLDFRKLWHEIEQACICDSIEFDPKNPKKAIASLIDANTRLQLETIPGGCLALEQQKELNSLKDKINKLEERSTFLEDRLMHVSVLLGLDLYDAPDELIKKLRDDAKKFRGY